MVRRAHTGVFFAAPAAFMALCRARPDLAGRWQSDVALPALRALHRLTARLPFPALEWLAVGLVLFTAVALLRRRGRACLALIVALLAGYALLWYPGYWAAPARDDPAPDAVQLEALCDRLIDRLSRSTQPVLSPDAAVRAAGAVAGLPDARVKAARFPGWMRLMRLSGLFSPWTGEAVVDPGAPPALIPFTAVHELMHLEGVADEGAANIAAWRRCTAREGPFADSARLWALKYALNALNRIDPAATLRVMGRVDASLLALCQPAGQAPPGPARRLCALLGIERAADSYDALAAWLVVTAQPAASL